MEDTQKYLNSILEKRLGSVPNQYAFRHDGNTVTRLPKKQQKFQSMPTVFKVKTQTIYKTTGVMPGQLQSKNPLLASSKSNQLFQQKKQDSGHNQRVEYVAISKRIQSKKQQVTAPPVDVTKYRKTVYVPPQQIKMNREQIVNNSQYNRNSQTNPSQLSQRLSSNALKAEQISKEGGLIIPRNEVNRASQISQGGKRRKIFGSSKQKLPGYQQ